MSTAHKKSKDNFANGQSDVGYESLIFRRVRRQKSNTDIGTKLQKTRDILKIAASKINKSSKFDILLLLNVNHICKRT